MIEEQELEQTGANRSRGGRVRKSANAFRTISEVSDSLDVPQHVLRFWETKFSQIKPMKRGGGRRYYRPEDILLLRGVRDLLYIDGYTIKGVQKLLREGGVKVLQERAGGQDGAAEATPVEAKAPVEPASEAAAPKPTGAPVGGSVEGVSRDVLIGVLSELEELKTLISQAK